MTEASEKKTPAKKGLTRDELKGLIRETVTEVVETHVDTALAPLKEQQTDWMAQIQATTKSVASNAPKSKGIGAARYLRALAFGKGDVDKAAWFAKECQKVGHWDDSLGVAVEKSLQAGVFTGAGFLLPDDFAAEIIELLRSATIVRGAGARVLPMPTGQLTIRRQDSPATATYVGEATNIDSSQPTGGQIVLTAKKLAAVVPISNDLLNFASGPTADEFVRDDLVQVLAIREDQAFLRDDGLLSKPKGLRNWAAAANLLLSNGEDAVDIELDFKDLVNALESNDVRMIRPAWFMSPRSKNHLRNVRDAAGGNLLFPEMRSANMTLYGWPVFVTTSIPNNLGPGADETEVYLTDMADAIIGESSGLEIAVDSSASYIEGGSLVSAFTRDETLMRAIMRHDFALRHDESCAIVTDVAWGA